MTVLSPAGCERFNDLEDAQIDGALEWMRSLPWVRKDVKALTV